ncbi:Apolipoprotein B-100 [Amphibalanus amphitrite]|uniref:Apolipoprotein B-100 n=1 Tax=Amphibalanus amphitrite TaxID=1232801 RepID=A0A6A4VYJ2_AMPAM|nr:Apolipoprotein B-100 [Amphibalanus amphitrite]
MWRRGGAAGRLAALLYLGVLVAAVAADRQCDPSDEFLSSDRQYDFLYTGSVELRHTAGAEMAASAFSFNCAVIVNGEQPCYHSLKLTMCTLDDGVTHPDQASREHSFNRLLKRGHIHFHLSGGDVQVVFVDPEEAEFITNVRRGVLNTLRVSRGLFNRPGKNVEGACERNVSRLGSDRYRVERSRGCDPAHNTPSILSPFSPLQSLALLERQLSVKSSCDYELDSDQLQNVQCEQTWELEQPTGDRVQVVVRQDLRLSLSRAAQSALPQNSREAPAGLEMRDSDAFIDLGHGSVFERLRELGAVSVPLMTPETPHKFTALLRALRRKYENPLEMAANCTTCSTFEKGMMSELSRTAVLQCGSAPCLRQVADMVREEQLTGARLTPLYLSWHWTPIRDAESGHSMFELCELAPTRWCLLGLAAALRRSAVPGGPSLERVAERLRDTAAEMIGPDCRRPDGDVIMALKTLRNMGPSALDHFPTLSLVRSCVADATRPVMVATEAVRTLSAARLPPKFARLLQDIYQSEKQALLTRQLAYLSLLRQFPSEREFRAALVWASSKRSDAMPSFILRHWKQFPLTDPRRPLTRALAQELGVDLAAVPDSLFNSATASVVREFQLGDWLRAVLPAVAEPQAGLQLWRLHGASFLPHLLYLNTSLQLGAGPVAPVELELRAVDVEGLIHDLVRDPEFDPTKVRGILREVATALLGAFGGRYGGASFVASLDEVEAPEQLRLSPAVAEWLRAALHSVQRRAAAPAGRPSAVLTLSVAGSQVAYLTAEEVLRRLQTPEPPLERLHLLGEKLFHSHSVFKFLEGQHRVPLAVGLPLELFTDGTVMAGAAAEISSRLGTSFRNLTEVFNGDAQLSASAGISVVAGLDVSLPPFAQARLQLNSTVFTPFSLNVSYAILNRTIQLTAPKPARKRTLLLISHGAQVLRGGELQPSPSAAVRTTRCLPQADFTGLTVCREVRAAGRLGFTAPLSYHVTAENTDPIDTYVLDVWTSARQDGYVHGGEVHLFLHQPAAAAADLRLHVGFRLMPINFNPALFHTGQKANTTVELVVGDEASPTWRLYLLRAQTERDDVLFSETRGSLTNRGVTLVSAGLEQHRSLPWLLGPRRDELLLRLAAAGDSVQYERRYRAARQTGGDADFSADLRYSTQRRDSLVERLLAPELFDSAARSAWLKLNYTRRLAANDELTELNWSHRGSAATAGVTLAGLLELTSTADSSARLVANVSSQRTETGEVLMYTAATADYNRDREGGAVTDSLQTSLSYPGAEFSGRARLERPADGPLQAEASAARRGGWQSRLSATLWPQRQLTATLELPGEQTVTLDSEFAAPARPRPWLPWYRDDYSFMQRSRLHTTWHALEVSSHTEITNDADRLLVDAALNLSLPGVAARVQLDWDKPGRLWDSDVALDTALLRLNSSVTSRRTSSGVGIERSFTQSSESPAWDILDHSLEGTVLTDCYNCSERQRDFDLKLEHKWLSLRSTSSRQFGDGGAAAGRLSKLDVELTRKADFLPSMTCQLKPEGDFSMALTLPAMGPPPKLDVRFTKEPPGRWKKVFTHSLEVDVTDGPRGRPMPALRVAVETTPGDPTRLAAELEVQPSLWLMVGQSAAGRLQLAAQQAAQAAMDPSLPINRLLKPLTGQDTLVDWLKTVPHRLVEAGGWLVSRAAALLSPWRSVVAPVYQTARNIVYATVSYVRELTAGLRQTAGERALTLLPPELMGQLMQKLNQLMSTALQRLPFKFERSVRGGRTRVELTELPDYANVETIWNLSSVVRERLRQPSVLSEMTARPDDRRPLAALWRDGRALALDGRSFMLPALPGCAQLLLADVEQRGFSVMRSGRQLTVTFLDCNLMVNERGQAHVQRFNVSLPRFLRTEVTTSPGRLVARSKFGVQVELDLGCGVLLLRLDPWMAPRTGGILAERAGNGSEAGGASYAYGEHCDRPAPSAAAAGPTLDIDSCGRLATPECSRLTGLERAARQHQPLCDSPSPVAMLLWRADPLASSEPVHVLLAVADPAVGEKTVRSVTGALERHLAQLGQRRVRYALVTDAADADRLSWVESPAELQLEGSKLRSEDLVATLHRLMTARPFPRQPAHRVLVVFAPSDEVRGGAALTGLRRQLWSSRVSVHLVTPLAQYPLLETPLHGLRPGGEVVTADSRQRLTLPPHQVRQGLTLPPHQGDLGQLSADSSGVVWDTALLRADGAVTPDLMADAVWQQVARSEPGPPLPGPSEAERASQSVGSAAPRPVPARWSVLAALCLLPLRLLAAVQ